MSESHVHDEKLVARLDRLKSQGEILRDQSIRSKTNLEQAHKEARRLREEAEKKYGTADVAQLKSLLVKWRSENQAAVDEYERTITAVSARLAELDKVLAQGS